MSYRIYKIKSRAKSSIFRHDPNDYDLELLTNKVNGKSEAINLPQDIKNFRQITTGSPLNELIFAFSSRFRLLLTSYAGLLIMLPLADLLLDTGFRAVSFESAESTI